MLIKSLIKFAHILEDNGFLFFITRKHFHVFPISHTILFINVFFLTKEMDLLSSRKFTIHWMNLKPAKNINWINKIGIPRNLVLRKIDLVVNCFSKRTTEIFKINLKIYVRRYSFALTIEIRLPKYVDDRSWYENKCFC